MDFDCSFSLVSVDGLAPYNLCIIAGIIANVLFIQNKVSSILYRTKSWKNGDAWALALFKSTLQISKKQCLEKYVLCVKACEFSALHCTP